MHGHMHPPQQTLSFCVQEFLQRKLAALSEKSLEVQSKNERYSKGFFGINFVIILFKKFDLIIKSFIIISE